MNSAKNKVIEITEFTDPVCTWCWGSEPVLRKLETRFGEQVKISYIMGGLVQDITSFYIRYGTAAPVEIQMTFDLANEEVKGVIDTLVTKQLLQKREAGNGYFLLPKVSSAACDTVTGVCSI